MDYKKIIDNEKSHGYFKVSLNDEAISYLLQKKCPEDVKKHFCSGIQGFAVENSFLFDEVVLGVDYFLGTSDNDVYDIIGFNENYNQRKNYVVIGVLQGGDTFGFLEGEEGVYLSLDTGTNFDDDVFARVSNSITDFLYMIIKK